MNIVLVASRGLRAFQADSGSFRGDQRSFRCSGSFEYFKRGILDGFQGVSGHSRRVMEISGVDLSNIYV